MGINQIRHIRIPCRYVDAERRKGTEKRRRERERERRREERKKKRRKKKQRKKELASERVWEKLPTTARVDSFSHPR